MAGGSRKPCVEPKPIVWRGPTASSFTAPCRCLMRSFRSNRNGGTDAPSSSCPPNITRRPPRCFWQHGFSMVIWANHMLRAAVAAMQKLRGPSRNMNTLLSIEDKVAPISEIFRLQNAAELQEAEDRYLPRGAEDTCAISARRIPRR